MDQHILFLPGPANLGIKLQLDTNNTLKGLQTLVDGLVDCVRPQEGWTHPQLATIDLWINDDGGYREDFDLNLEASFLVGYGIIGPAVVARSNKDGETIGLTPEDFAAFTEMGMNIMAIEIVHSDADSALMAIYRDPSCDSNNS